ncbi:hypothetical protein ABN235_19255, partial [Morganella morganii]|uniref:hypothetical protein n=1 Tax=Morganella morganii TaxID=582 RepID=UPI0032D9B61E
MAALTWSDDEADPEVEADTEEITGNFVAFTARITTNPEDEDEDPADSEGCDYNSAEDLEAPAFTYEIEYKKLYSKWECLLKANRNLCSQVGISEKAINVYKDQISERDLQLKAA